MSDPQPKRKRPNPADIADLFRVLRNMCSDEAVSDANFRIAFRIAQCVDTNTGWGEAGDVFLSDEVPRTDKGKVKRFRKVMRDELGWVKTIKGERGRATRYEFQETRCEAIEAARAELKERRHAQSAMQKIQNDTEMKVASLGGCTDPLLEFEVDPFTGEISPPIDHIQRGESVPVKGAGKTPTLPHSSTSQTGYRQQDGTQDACAPMPARADLSAIVCKNCDAPAVIEGREEFGGVFYPFCQECREDAFLAGERPIPSNGNSPDPDNDAYRAQSRG